MRHLTLLILLLLIAPAHAEEPAEAPTKPMMGWKDIPWYHRLGIHGYVDTYYLFNLNRPADGANFVPGIGTSGKRANEFTLNLAAVELSLDPEPLGFRLVLNYGTGTEVLHGAERDSVATSPGAWKFLQEASVSYKVPIGNGLIVTGGVYPSHIGWEVLQSRDNWNYTRTWVSDMAPFYQTGLRLSYAFTQNLSAQVHLLNGWQVIGDNNEAKSVGAQLMWNSDRVTAALNLLAGPELPDDNRSWRVLTDLYGVWRPKGWLSLAAVADLGLQEFPDRPAALWYGAELFARVQPLSYLALCLRGGLFSDPHNGISGAEQTLAEGTATVEVRPLEELIIKIEGRFDYSTAPVFSGDRKDLDGKIIGVQQQGLLGVGGVVSF